MTTNLTLITTIVLTAAMTSAGTYFLTTSGQQPGDNTVSEAATQPSEPQPTPVAAVVTQQPNKPVEIIIKTEVVEKHKYRDRDRDRDIVAENIAFRKLPQPHLEVTQNTPTGK